jgi:hypothetical protein
MLQHGPVFQAKTFQTSETIKARPFQRFKKHIFVMRNGAAFTVSFTRKPAVDPENGFVEQPDPAHVAELQHGRRRHLAEGGQINLKTVSSSSNFFGSL